MLKWLLAALAVCALIAPAQAQQVRSVVPYSQVITTGLTYQQIRPREIRSSITIQNNNSADLCYLFIGASEVTAGATTTATTITINGQMLTAAQASIMLGPGDSWQRYFPYSPDNAIFGTCATTGDSLYVDIQ